MSAQRTSPAGAYRQQDGQAYARVHAETGMVQIAEFGFVNTCVALDQYPDHVRRHVTRQLSETTTA